jgi:hypothetical protein
MTQQEHRLLHDLEQRDQVVDLVLDPVIVRRAVSPRPRRAMAQVVKFWRRAGFTNSQLVW